MPTGHLRLPTRQDGVEKRGKVYSEPGSKNASDWSSPKGFKSCFQNAAINYRQTRSDDRFTLVKMNITKSRNHDYK